MKKEECKVIKLSMAETVEEPSSKRQCTGMKALEVVLERDHIQDLKEKQDAFSMVMKNMYMPQPGDIFCCRNSTFIHISEDLKTNHISRKTFDERIDPLEEKYELDLFQQFCAESFCKQHDLFYTVTYIGKVEENDGTVLYEFAYPRYIYSVWTVGTFHLDFAELLAFTLFEQTPVQVYPHNRIVGVVFVNADLTLGFNKYDINIHTERNGDRRLPFDVEDVHFKGFHMIRSYLFGLPMVLKGTTSKELKYGQDFLPSHSQLRFLGTMSEFEFNSFALKKQNLDENHYNNFKEMWDEQRALVNIANAKSKTS